MDAVPELDQPDVVIGVVKQALGAERAVTRRHRLVVRLLRLDQVPGNLTSPTVERAVVLRAMAVVAALLRRLEGLADHRSDGVVATVRRFVTGDAIDLRPRHR